MYLQLGNPGHAKNVARRHLCQTRRVHSKCRLVRQRRFEPNSLLGAQEMQLKRRSAAGEAVSVGKTVAMTTAYVAGSTNDELIAGLHDPDPIERAKNAEGIGVFHIYLALPHLLDVARTDADENVREAARSAVLVLMPSEEAAPTAPSRVTPHSERLMGTPRRRSRPQPSSRSSRATTKPRPPRSTRCSEITT